MFQYLNKYTHPEELYILISFYNDIRDAIEDRETPKSVLAAYLKEFPQYQKSLKRQYQKDKQQGFPPEDDIAEEIATEEFKTLLEYALHEITILQNPGGQMLLEIEDRVNYLDKCYLNRKLGANFPIKDW